MKAYVEPAVGRRNGAERWCLSGDMERQRLVRDRERLLQLEKARGVGIGSRVTRFGGNVDVGAANEVHRNESIEAGASV